MKNTQEEEHRLDQLIDRECRMKGRHLVCHPAKRILKTRLFGDVPLSPEDYEWWMAELARCARVEDNPNLTSDDLLQRLVDLAKENDMTLEELTEDLAEFQGVRPKP